MKKFKGQPFSAGPFFQLFKYHMYISLPSPQNRSITMTSWMIREGYSDMATLKTAKGAAANKPLTAAEVSALWLQYLGDTMSICVYKYFLKINENTKFKPVFELSLQLAEQQAAEITGFLKREHFHIPVGFGEGDVNLNAPRLFSDSFLLFYSYIMTIHGLTAYSLAVTSCDRKDIQNYYARCIESTTHLFQKISELVQAEPKFSPVPTIPTPDGVKLIESTGIISNLIGDKQPLNSSEISNLFFNAKKTGFVRTLSMAFSQVAEHEDVVKFLLKNVKLAGKDADSFDAFLKQDDLSIPQRWDDEITDSKVSPFSDKLIMFHAAFMVNAALSYYGASLGSSLRSDIILNYKQVFGNAMEAGSGCYSIMVKHNWLEQQPGAIDREALAKD